MEKRPWHCTGNYSSEPSLELEKCNHSRPGNCRFQGCCLWRMSLFPSASHQHWWLCPNPVLGLSFITQPQEQRFQQLVSWSWQHLKLWPASGLITDIRAPDHGSLDKMPTGTLNFKALQEKSLKYVHCWWRIEALINVVMLMCLSSISTYFFSEPWLQKNWFILVQID